MRLSPTLKGNPWLFAPPSEQVVISFPQRVKRRHIPLVSVGIDSVSFPASFQILTAFATALKSTSLC
jgi:hypothetical protein